jgi:hypothetical protein
MSSRTLERRSFPSKMNFVVLELKKLEPGISCRDLNSNRVLLQTIGG